MPTLFRGFSTFRARVFWSVIPIVLTLSVIYGIFEFRERQTLAEAEFMKRGQAMVANLASSTRLAVFSEDRRLLASSIEVFLGAPDVAYVVIYGDRGTVLAAGGKHLNEPAKHTEGLTSADSKRLFSDGKPLTHTLEKGGITYHEFLAPIVSEPTKLPDELLLGSLDPSRAMNSSPNIIGAVKLSLSLERMQSHGAELLKVWLVVTAAFFVFSTLIIYQLSRRITLPIKQLTTQAQKIADGYLDHQIVVQTRDELGQLATSFNEMAIALKKTITEKESALSELQGLNSTLEQRIQERTAEIQQRTNELQRSLQEVRALGEISQAVSSSLDVARVLATVARYAVELSDSHACGIFEFNIERRAFEVVGSYNMSPAFVQQIHAISIDAQRAAQMQSNPLAHAVQMPDLQSAQHSPLSTATLDHGYRSLLIVPMEYETVPSGVVLFRKVAGPFDDATVSLLTALASQSGIAIENARLFRKVQSQRVELERLSKNQQQLYRLSTTLQEPLSLKDQLHEVLEAAREVVEIDRFCIWVSHGDDLHALTGAGFDKGHGFVEGARIPLAEAGAMGVVYNKGTPLSFDERNPLPSHLRLKPPYSEISLVRSNTFLIIPMVARGHSIGVLTADNKWSRKPIRANTSELIHIFASHAAVAIENARLFEDLEARGQQLAIASQHKSQFLANMSHELRTPLNAILGYMELILDNVVGEVPGDIRDCLQRAQKSGHHLLSLINDVLDLSKIEAGQLTLSIGEYSLAEVVHAIASSMGSLATEKCLGLKTTIPPQLPTGRGDVQRITQVLMNLVGNAIKFTEVGEVCIDAKVSGENFVISVIDTGPGVAPADQQRIFEEFQQLDSSSTRKKGGTGLGLSIVKRIVELHGGKMGLESAAKKGSTFWFMLPVQFTGKERELIRHRPHP